MPHMPSSSGRSGAPYGRAKGYRRKRGLPALEGKPGRRLGIAKALATPTPATPTTGEGRFHQFGHAPLPGPRPSSVDVRKKRRPGTSYTTYGYGPGAR